MVNCGHASMESKRKGDSSGVEMDFFLRGAQKPEHTDTLTDSSIERSMCWRSVFKAAVF
jgi:hypothetical protein